MVQIHQIPFFILSRHGDGDAIGVFCVADAAVRAACAFMAEGQKTAIIFCLRVSYLVVLLFNLVNLLFTLCTVFNLLKNAHNCLTIAY